LVITLTELPNTGKFTVPPTEHILLLNTVVKLLVALGEAVLEKDVPALLVGG
jgi:hypothetical protein